MRSDEGAGGAPAGGPSRAPRRRRLTRLRRLAHVAIVPAFVAAAVAPSEPEAVLVVSVLVALVVAVWLTRFAGARVRAALDESRAVRVLDLTLWNIALVVLLLEVGLVVASQVVSSPLLTPPNAKSRQRVRDFRFGPHAPYLGGRANAGGFHDTEWVTPRPPDTFRIVALGDSFNFGIVPYAQNVLTLLEGELTRRCGRKVEVANMGIAGTAPVDYLFLLNDEGLLLEPDLVLTSVFVGNDIGVVRSGSRLRPANWLTFAITSRLLRIAAERLGRSQAQPGAGGKTAAVGTPMSPERFMEHVVNDYLPTLTSPTPEGIERRYASTLEVLGAIDAIARDRHAIAVYPCEVQVDPDLLTRACAEAKVDPRTIDSGMPGRRIAAHFAARGTPVCDLLPAFTARRAEGRAYEPYESHWNALGNRVAALALADWLEPIVRARLAR